MEAQTPSIKQFGSNLTSNSNLTKTFYPAEVQIQFDQQSPLKMNSCSVSFHETFQQVINDLQNQSSSANIDQPKQIQKHLETEQITDSFIFINYEIQSQGETKKINFLIPMNSIMCLGKKSGSTLLMLKDKEKDIERDENGYQLVSDDQEQYEQKQNKLYKAIGKVLSKSNSITPSNNQTIYRNSSDFNLIRIDQKCSIILTVKSKQLNRNHNPQSLQLYNYLSLKLQQYEKKIANYPKNQWQNNFENFQAFDSIRGEFSTIQPQCNEGNENQDGQFDEDQDYDQQIDGEKMDFEQEN